MRHVFCFAMSQNVKPTTIRINEDLKREAVAIFDSIDLSYNSYVMLATRQLVNQLCDSNDRRRPFGLRAFWRSLSLHANRLLIV